MSIRPVKRLIKSKPTLEGAGVHLRRAFGFGNTHDFDPFLLLDDFRNDVPEDYLAGFPWHPHRGIETITYVLAGTVEHGDSMGNHGAIASGRCSVDDRRQRHHSSGDAEGRRHRTYARLSAVGEFALGAQDDRSALPGSEDRRHSGSHRRRWNSCTNCVRKFLGQIWACRRNRRRSDLSRCFRSSGKRKTLPVETTRHAFAYVFAGDGKFCNASGPLAVPTEGVGWADTKPPADAENRSLVVFDRGDEVAVQAGEDGIRFLLVSGKPLEEPVAWYGPIVMNTQQELQEAFRELDQGTFLKK